jgi:dipeptidase D
VFQPVLLFVTFDLSKSETLHIIFSSPLRNTFHFSTRLRQTEEPCGIIPSKPFFHISKEPDMSERVLAGVAPERVWHYFEEISAIPRCSQHEAKIREYLKDFAREQNLAFQTDKIGNVVIKKAGTRGYEGSPTVVLQGHMDIVCEKNADVQHNFLTDPLKLKKEGDWLTAEGTTLGADNGIAIAMALAILESRELDHGPIEALMTVDEESGLTGALQMDPAIIDGRILVNLDSEEEGVFYIGCAGGLTTHGWIPIEWTSAPGEYGYYKLQITGLRGGHSGGDIHKHRGNAICFGSRIMWDVLEKIDLRIVSLRGGGKHNAIPREFFASFMIPQNQKDSLETIFLNTKKNIENEFSDCEPGLTISLEQDESAPQKVLTPEASFKTINSLFIMPHGVDEMSRAIPGLVETSTNLAAVELQDHEVIVVTSQRSSMTSKRDNIAKRITAVLRCTGARVSYSSVYPAWTPDPENPLVPIFSEVYRDLTGKKAEVKAIHAGLECGVIGDRFSDMTMISLGPDLRDVHTPNEKLSIPSVDRTYALLLKVLKKLAE